MVRTFLGPGEARPKKIFCARKGMDWVTRELGRAKPGRRKFLGCLGGRRSRECITYGNTPAVVAQGVRRSGAWRWVGEIGRAHV